MWHSGLSPQGFQTDQGEGVSQSVPSIIFSLLLLLFALREMACTHGTFSGEFAVAFNLVFALRKLYRFGS